MGRNRYGVEIEPAKYRAGVSVIVTFAKTYGLPKTRIRGYIRSVKGRFLDTPELANFRYEVILDKQYCSTSIMSVLEDQITEGG